MLREPFIQECVVGAQKIDHTAILFHDAFKKQLRLATERLPQIIVEVRELPAIRTYRRQIAQVQPLSGEIALQRLRARIRQHSPDLALKHRRLVKFALNREVQ